MPDQSHADVPAELDQQLALRPGAAGGWPAAEPATPALYAGWVAETRLQGRRHQRAESTAACPAQGELKDHITYLTNSPWDWVGEVVFALIPWW